LQRGVLVGVLGRRTHPSSNLRVRLRKKGEKKGKEKESLLDYDKKNQGDVYIIIIKIGTEKTKRNKSFFSPVIRPCQSTA
jgi:hypothetical protein